MLSVKGVVNVDVDEETIKRCWSAVNEDPTDSKVIRFHSDFFTLTIYADASFTRRMSFSTQ